MERLPLVRGRREAAARPTDAAYPCFCTPRGARRRPQAPGGGQAAAPLRRPLRAADRRGARARARPRAARGALRFRVGEGVVAWDDIVRGRHRDRRREHRRRLRHRPRRRDAALPLRGRRRRRGDGDDPRHPRRGPHLEHAQAHPAVPGARPRGAARSPTCRSSSTRPDEDEQAQEPDRDRRLPRRGLHPRGARQLPRAARLVDRHRGRDPVARRDRRAVRHRTRSTRPARSSTGTASSG